ncbi:trimethyllysine dioxygenase, mitochondrial-like [Tigriopus californicus]|nr:trimethyllysine dioxygenase, mitochondrial-like [Tigriopus californicus]
MWARPLKIIPQSTQRMIWAGYHVSRGSDHLSIAAQTNGFEHKFTFEWLRDHCRDPSVYDSDTHQRSISILDINPDVHPFKFQVIQGADDVLSITWNDGHVSTYDLKWLIRQSGQENRKQAFKSPIQRTPWNIPTLPQSSQTNTDFQEFMDSAKGVEKVIRSIREHGFAMVDGVEPTTKATKLTVERMVPVSQTIYGEMFELRNEEKEDVSDSSYSNVALGAHTDTTYYNEAFGLQIFHCLQPAARGGANILVDGFKIAELLKKANPDAYQFFRKTPLEAEYIHSRSEPQEHYYNVDYVFKHHPISDELEQFRFNVYDRAPHKMGLSEQRLFYRYYRELAALIVDETNVMRVQLHPGTVLFIDNWRVMHGRTGFQGQRIMSGCYVNRSDFISRAKVFDLA